MQLIELNRSTRDFIDQVENLSHSHLSYFPGCSLATTAKENNASLHTFIDHFGRSCKSNGTAPITQRIPRDFSIASDRGMP